MGLALGDLRIYDGRDAFGAVSGSSVGCWVWFRRRASSTSRFVEDACGTRSLNLSLPPEDIIPCPSLVPRLASAERYYSVLEARVNIVRCNISSSRKGKMCRYVVWEEGVSGSGACVGG